MSVFFSVKPREANSGNLELDEINQFVHRSQPERGIKNNKTVKINKNMKVGGKHKLSCVYFNARSINNKLDELALLITEESPDIVGITETWLNNDVFDFELFFDGYTLIRRDRADPDKERGGGVAFLIKSNLKPVRRPIGENKKVEILFCSIESGGQETLLGLCYRPNDTKAEINLELFSIIDEVKARFFVLLGDFNYPELMWYNDESVDRNHSFVECLDRNFLHQMLTEPSRGENFLNLIISSDTSIIENLSVGENFGLSDHNTIRFSILAQSCRKASPIQRYNYFKAEYSLIRQNVSERGWGSLIQCQNVDIIWDQIKFDLLDLRNNFVNKKSRVKKNRSNWITPHITKLRKIKKSAWLKYQKSNKDTKLYDEYKCKLRLSVKENKKAKLEYESKLADNIKTDCKSFFAYINPKSRSSHKIGPIKDGDNFLISDNKTMGNCLNQYFSSVFTQENLTNVPENQNSFSQEFFSDLKIEENEVLTKLSKINVKKSLGPDELHGKLIYEVRHELVKPLTHLFNLSIKLGHIPQDWKDANIIPIFKKGNRSEPGNYRPVSLTCILGKILESIIKEKLCQHFDKYNLIRDTQHGFLSGKSCLTNLIEFFEQVTEDLDSEKSVDLVYLDFSKAFDKVAHVRLANKLLAHGVGGNILNWIQSWLRGRRQRVSIEGEYSEWAWVTSGVPQGSVLGPLLFLVYINDLEENLISKLAKFADDSKLKKTVDSNQEIGELTQDLKNLEKWADTWQMNFNIDKCAVIHLGKNNPNYDYCLYNTTLRSTDMERDLGVLIDKTMKFSEHCNAVAKSANATLGMIKRNITSRDNKVITKFYKALVRPKLEYCVQAWRPFLQKDIDKLEKVQRRATRLVSQCRGLSYDERLKITGLTSLEKRRNRGDMIEVFKIIKGFSKIDRNKLFTFNSDGRTRGHSLKLAKSRSRLEIRKNFFSQRVINEWNNLPNYVVEASSVNSFKNRYDSITVNTNHKL